LSQPTRLASALAPPLGAPGAPSALSRWFGARLDDAAEAFAALGERLRPRRKLVFVEQADGTLASPRQSCRLSGGRLAFERGHVGALRGAEVEFRLAPQRCVFRELELPARAGEFLDGVVRSQIDRLTPWAASDCAFGWSAPKPLDAGRIAITVAATKREPIAAFLDVAADSVIVASARDAGSPAIAILSTRAGASARRRRWRFMLTAALALSLAALAAALAADYTLGASLRDQSDALTASLAQRRAAMLRRDHARDDPAAQALDARKRATPAAVIALEALTKAIPDDAYLTQMQLKGDVIEISGVAADAASLISRIEQSPSFSHATFTAPTTRGAENKESFRIEAHVAPAPRGMP
jgi:general secretion pathway protein L